MKEPYSPNDQVFVMVREAFWKVTVSGHCGLLWFRSSRTSVISPGASMLYLPKHPGYV